VKRGAGALATVLLLAAFLVGCFAVVAPRPAAAAPSLGLTAQTPWTLVGGSVELDLEIADPPSGAAIQVVVYEAIGSRSAFDQTLVGEYLDEIGVLDEVDVPLGLLPLLAGDRRRLTLDLVDPIAPVADRLPIREPGVYPMEVSLVGDDAEPVTFVTYLVVVGGDGTAPAIGERLGMAWIWPLVATPILAPDGSLAPEAIDELRPDGRVGRQAVALAQSDVPVTVAPGPFTTQQWLDGGLSTAAALRRVVSPPNQVLASGYVPVDLPSLLAADLGAVATTALVQGTTTLEASLGARIDPRTVVADPIDAASFAQLTDANVDRLVVDPRDLEATDSSLTPARPFRLNEGERSAQAAALDTGLAELVTGTQAPALRAQQLLTALSLIASEAPNRARGVVVANPLDWDPEPEFLQAVLDGLRGHPMLEPMTLAQFFDSVPMETDDGAERELAPRPPEPPPVSSDEHREASEQHEAFRSLTGPESPSLVPGDRALLVALAATWGPDSADARRQLALVTETINQFLAKIRIPVGSSITLTARTGSIPLTFVNDTGENVTVRVNLDSDKLDFPEGSVRDLVLEPRATTERFEIRSRTPGRFPMVLTVSSPDGGLVVSSTRIDVRSTAVSGVGIFLTAGAGVVLAGWWMNDIRKRRGGRRATSPQE